MELKIGDNSVLKDVDISECYQLTYCEINNPLIKNKCFTTRSTPEQFLTQKFNNIFKKGNFNYGTQKSRW